MPNNFTLLFANNARSTLAAGINNVATSLQLTSGGGALFPGVGAGQAFVATLEKVGFPTIQEIILVTARTGDTFGTIQRDYDGTGALSWSAGDYVNIYTTASDLNAMVQVPAAQGQQNNYALDTGAANAYAITLTPPLTGHVVGMPIRWKAANANTGASTFNDGISAHPLVTMDGHPLVADDIQVLGAIYETIWDGTEFHLMGVNRTNFAQLAGTIANPQIGAGAVTQFEADLEIAFSQLTGLPTTVAGYGITDAITLAAFSGSNTQTGFQSIPFDPAPPVLIQRVFCNPNNGSVSISWPTTFPTAVWVAVATATAAPSQCDITALSASGATIFNTGGQAYVIAIGH